MDFEGEHTPPYLTRAGFSIGDANSSPHRLVPDDRPSQGAIRSHAMIGQV
jgi:hypothetical protein